MLVTFRTIAQLRFSLNIEETDTVLDVKKMAIEKKLQGESPETIKMIFNGKVLDDAQTFGELNYTFDKFVVVMTQKKKQAPVDTLASTAAPAAESTATTTAAPTSSPAPAAVAQTTQSSVSTPAPTVTTDATPERILSTEQENMVEAIAAMGYPRDQVIQALRLAFFNPDRAVEYLCTGFPDSSSIVDSSLPEAVTPRAPSTGGLDSLSQNPAFLQLRDAVRSDPSSLSRLIHEMAESNPELLETIQNNQEDFVSLLNLDSNPTRQEGIGAGRQSGGSANFPEVLSIPVTTAERNAIERLKAMGFAESLVVEAYFSCDKNEDLAVNYILARMDEAEAEQEAALRDSRGSRN